MRRRWRFELLASGITFLPVVVLLLLASSTFHGVFRAKKPGHPSQFVRIRIPSANGKTPRIILSPAELMLLPPLSPMSGWFVGFPPPPDPPSPPRPSPPAAPASSNRPMSAAAESYQLHIKPRSALRLAEPFPMGGGS